MYKCYPVLPLVILFTAYVFDKIDEQVDQVGESQLRNIDRVRGNGSIIIIHLVIIIVDN